MSTDKSIQIQLDEYFSHCTDEFIETIAQLVAIKSVQEEARPGLPFGQGPAEALALGLEIAVKLGFNTLNYDNYVGTVDLNTEKTLLGILCHLDVVGEGSGWSTPPYQVVSKDGKLYGRGVSDDKGPAVAALYAMKAVKDLGIPLKFNARLILGTDEETGSSDIEYYFQREPVPQYTFSPDGHFPVLNTEKGGLRPNITKTWLTNEDLPRVTHANGGERINVIPSLAEAWIEGLSVGQVQSAINVAIENTCATYEIVQENGLIKILVTGKSEHASAPEKGCNAVTALLSLLASLPLAVSESFSTIQNLAAMFPHGDYYGKALGIAQSDDISGSLTVSLDIFSLNTSGFDAWFDSRTPLCTTKENSLDIVKQKCADYGILFDGDLSPSHHTPADSPFVQTLLSVYEQYTGKQGYCEYTGGGTYVHGIEGGVCFGASMPGVASNAHGPDEYIPIKDLLTASKIYAQVIVNLCS